MEQEKDLFKDATIKHEMQTFASPAADYLKTLLQINLWIFGALSLTFILVGIMSIIYKGSAWWFIFVGGAVWVIAFLNHVIIETIRLRFREKNYLQSKK